MVNIGYMRFFVQDGLIEVGNAPALRNVELEQLGEFLCGLAGDSVAPRPKGNQQVIISIEGQVTMHHGAETDSANGVDLEVVLLKNLAGEVTIALLQTCPN